MLNQEDKENDHYRLSTIDSVHKSCKGCSKRHYPWAMKTQQPLRQWIPTRKKVRNKTTEMKNEK